MLTGSVQSNGEPLEGTIIPIGVVSFGFGFEFCPWAGQFGLDFSRLVFILRRHSTYSILVSRNNRTKR
jgi:hypothetical protein